MTITSNWKWWDFSKNKPGHNLKENTKPNNRGSWPHSEYIAPIVKQDGDSIMLWWWFSLEGNRGGGVRGVRLWLRFIFEQNNNTHTAWVTLQGFKGKPSMSITLWKRILKSNWQHKQMFGNYYLNKFLFEFRWAWNILLRKYTKPSVSMCQTGSYTQKYYQLWLQTNEVLQSINLLRQKSKCLSKF